MAFTRTSFAQVCQKFISTTNDDSQNEFLARGLRGWKWTNHSTVHNYNTGCLERIGCAFQLPTQHTESQRQREILAENDFGDNALEDEDDAAAAAVSSPVIGSLIVQESIAYSPTFQTPVFYFLVYSQDGAVLPLSAIMQTTLLSSLRDTLPSDAQVTPHSISFHNSNFPMLSLGDHPVLNKPYWYLHPCQSSAAVDEIMQAIPRHDDDDYLLLWLKTWFLVLRSLVDIR